MARDHARILTSIWSDRDFRARTRGEQWLFVRMLSDRHINNAGVLPLFESKWARAAVDGVVDDIEKDRRGLVASRFLVVDEDTDEALVRSFMRGDRVYRQPNVLRNALSEAVVTESPVLRAALAVELRRISAMLPSGKGYETLPEAIEETIATLAAQPIGNPSEEPIGNPSHTVDTNPSGSRGVGEGVGEGGSSTSRSGTLSRSSSSTRDRDERPVDHRGAAELVDTAVPRSWLDETERGQLIAQAAKVLDRGIPADVLAEALDEWGTRPGVTAGLLPRLVTDALKARRNAALPGTGEPSKFDRWAAIAARLDAEAAEA